MNKTEKAKRVSALLAAVVWSVALLIFLFPPLVVTQAPPVKQIIGVPEQLLCPLMPAAGTYEVGAQNLTFRVNSDWLAKSTPPAVVLWQYCLAPGGNVTVVNTGQTPLLETAFLTATNSSFLLQPGQRVTVLPVRDGVILLTSQNSPNSLPNAVIQIGIAAPTALRPYYPG